MMLKKAVLITCVAFFIQGCGDDGNEVLTKIPGDGVQQTSETAIYFRGGAGVDFGRAANTDILGVEAGNNYRMVSYEFEEVPDQIDESIRPILEGAGYKRTVKNTEGVSLHAWYEVPDVAKRDFVNVRYVVSVGEGFAKKTTVYLSWYYDN